VIRLGRIVLFGLAVAAASSVACGSKSTTAGPGDKPKVAVSIFPIYDLARRIAGDRLDVVLVLPAGQSEHGYDPTPKEMAALEGTKLAIAVGLEMDRWVENIMKAAGNPPVFRVGEKVPTIKIEIEPISEAEVKAHEAGHHHHDDADPDKKAGSAVKKDEHDDHDHDKGAAAKGPIKKDDKKGSAAKKDDHDEHDHDKHGAAIDKGSAAKKADDKKGSAAKKDDHDEHDHDKGSAKKDDHDHDKGSAAKKAGHEGHQHAEVGSPDPHFWMDPNLVLGAIDAIVAQLATLDPGGKATFTANADAIKKSLRELDAKITARRKTWTKSVIVTFHGSMAYFARRYGILIAAVVEPIAGTEPTAQYIDQVVAAVKRGKAAALFTEPQLSKGPGEAIAREAGIPLGELDPVGGVAGRDSYEALLNWNADQLEKALK
jgi:zinc transport system substrate-binding protein